MNDDTRLRDGLSARGGPSGLAAAAVETGVYAALDLGTNNCRLLIACPAGDGFRVVDSFSRIIRLGEGISSTGSISEAAIERAIAALSICSDKIRYRKARRLRLIATEACRAADNAEQLSRARRGRNRHPAGSDRPRDRGDAGRHRLLAAARPERARRDPVRHRRRLDRTGADRARSGRAGCGAPHQGLDVDPARRRHAGRSISAAAT